MGLLSVAAVRHPELMDDPCLPEADHLHALQALGTINAVSRTSACLAAAVTPLLAAAGPGPVEIVDLACGGGDVNRGCARRLVRSLQGRRLAVTGIDTSPRALARARADLVRDHGLARDESCRVTFATRDLVADGCPPCDVAVSSLFLHHLDDADAIGLLRSMREACRLGFVVSDLVRSRLGLILAVLGTGLLSTSRVARVDGPLSVRAARTAGEYRRLLDAAGLPEATIRRAWPERAVIAWRRGSPS
ncbi:MAG: methyltransferase [Planctomycetaceae bacterium]